MSKSSRQSQVQTRILLALNRGPVPTVAELSRLVQVLRPSAHRSLANLMEKNMVIRDGGRWKLTRSGMEAVASAQEGLKLRAQKLLTKTAREVTRLSMVASLTDALSDRPFYQTLDALSLGSGGGLKAVINSTQETLLGFSPFRDLVDPITLDLRKIDLLGGMVDSISVQGGKLDSFRAGGVVDSISVQGGKYDPFRVGGMVNSISVQGGKLDSFRAGGMVDSIRAEVGKTDLLGGMVNSISGQGGKFDPFRVGGMVDSISGQGGKFESVLGGRDLFSLGTPVLSAFAIDPLLQVQKKQNDLLGSALLSGMSSPLTIDLGQSNRILGKAVESLGSMIHESIARPMFSAALTQVQPLFGQLVDVTRTYRSYMDEQLGQLGQNLYTQSVRLGTVLPTEAVVRYVDSVGTFAEAQGGIAMHTRPYDLSADIQSDLDSLLASVDSELVDIRGGAWDTFTSQGRDRLRQSVYSMRELITKLTHRLAPDSSFPAPVLARGRPTRMMRLKAIADGSESTAEYIEAIAKCVDVHYAELSKIAKTKPKHELSVRLVLEAAERCIHLLLIQAPSNNRHN